MGRYARLLLDINQVDHFLTTVLEFEPEEDEKDIAFKIVNSEKALIDYDHPGVHTLMYDNYRDRNYKTEAARWALREQIINELITTTRLDNDDDICLGRGGALPQTGVKAEKKAFIVIGLPASGKSGISNMISDKYHAIIIDSDYAKRKLPEFRKLPWGASLVHLESVDITFGFKDNPKKVLGLQTLSIRNGYNIVLPRIGNKSDNIIRTAEKLNSLGYEVHLTLIALPKREATIRAIKRYNKSGRYVPLGMIFDDFGNDPSLTYYLLKCERSDLFKSFGAISTDVEPGEPYITVNLEGDNPAAMLKFKKINLN
ncbi:zeta toxin family protein [Chitinophaga sp.]|uniref:zeta toxin family protein n=1 Tax=Chitinophaga sp. TaxID=1869181 RepID=UPI0031D721D4